MSKLRTRCAAVLLYALLAACSGHSSIEVTPGPPPLPGGFVPGSDAGIDVGRDCSWSLTEELNVLNLFYLEEYANYWISALVIPPGGHVRIRGRYPHARYMSFNIYSATLKPIGVLADVHIQPDAGSVNPFVAGAARQSPDRDFTVRVLPQLPPTQGAEANTLYSMLPLTGVAPALEPLLPDWLLETTLPSNVMLMIYRVYLPDTGTSRSGGVDLPDVEIVTANGTVFSGPDVCNFLEPALPTLIHDALAHAELGPLRLGLSIPPSTAALPELHWYKHFDLLSTYIRHLSATPVLSELPVISALDFPRTLDNEYLMGYVSQQHGELVSLRARAPTHRRTVRGEDTATNTQVRYFSICANDFYTRRMFDCVYDEEIPVRDGKALVLVGRAADRPWNATYECGVAWLDWGLFAESMLIYRQMTPGESPIFGEAMRLIPPPSGTHERAVMGEFYPRAEYGSKREFEALGCPVGAGAGG